MQISKDTMEPFLLDYARKASDNNYEWSFKFLSSSGWTEDTFNTVISTLRSNDDLNEQIFQEKLSIVPSEGGAILEIESIPHISQYCLTESVANIPHKWYSYIAHESQLLPDEFPIHIISHIMERKEFDKSEYDSTSWQSIAKFYKLIKVFSYSTDDNKIEYRVSLIRECENITNSMIDANLANAKIEYRFEMFIKIYDNIENIIDYTIPMIQILTQQNVMVSKSHRNEIIKEYDSLIKTVLQENPYYDRERKNKADSSLATTGTKPGQETDKVLVQAEELEEKSHFLTPKPITLEQHNLIEPGPNTYGIQSILNNYCVTDKADGERMLMYISKIGEAYLINNVFDVIDTGMKVSNPKLMGSILDGEYIKFTQRRDNNTNDIFAAFDIYFIDGKSVMDLPLIKQNKSKTQQQDKDTKNTNDNRYSIIQFVCDKKNWVDSFSSIELRYKEHVFAEGKEMFSACKDFLQQARNLPYNIDGLIFTPALLSVFGFYPGRPLEKIPINVRWDKVFKWKPSDQNTIDFLVEEMDEIYDVATKQRFKQFKLYTGYNASQQEPITPMEGLRRRYDRKYATSIYKMKTTYFAKPFNPLSNNYKGIEIAQVPIIGNKAICEDKSIIGNKSIVEFSFDINRKNSSSVSASKCWMPLRVREDKTRIYQKTGELSKTANDISVATSIWRSIHKPVTKAMIIGDEPIGISSISDSIEERLLGIDDVYYARDIPRQHMLSVNMLDFHNLGIKKMLYEQSKSKEALLEIACGMAGDLHRWREGGYRFIMGVDISRDNIMNAREGAYARMLKQRIAVKTLNAEGVEKTIYPDTVFLVGDCSLPFQNGEAAEAQKDDESKRLFKILYNRNASAPEYLSYISGRAGKKFTMISCMFAIHYFFQTEEKLNGFLTNVATNLRSGGIFITTFMDGDRVHNLIEQHSTAPGRVEGRKPESSIPVWALIKRYNTFDDENLFGKYVDVFLENTNKLIPEFLVKYDLLKLKAEEFGLKVVNTELFSDTFYRLKDAIDKTQPVHKLSRLDQAIMALDGDEVQKQFSFVNRWVIFEKA